MKGHNRGWRALSSMVCLLLLTTLVACSSAPAKQSENRGPATQGITTTDGAKTASQPASFSPGEGEASGSSAAPAGQSGAALPWDRMIVRTVTLSAIVKDVEAAIGAVRDIASSTGGFVLQSSSRYDGDQQVATMTIQVPAERFDAAVAEIRAKAVKVESENGSTQDVTEEYSDLEAQVRNLQATETGLQGLMEKATRMEDILALQRELTNVRGEIEKRQGRMKLLSRRSEMSTITVSLRPEALAAPGSPMAWNPLETAERAWQASTRVLIAIANVAIATIVFLWWVIPMAVAGLYVWQTRRIRQRTGTAA